MTLCTSYFYTVPYDVLIEWLNEFFSSSTSGVFFNAKLRSACFGRKSEKLVTRAVTIGKKAESLINGEKKSPEAIEQTIQNIRTHIKAIQIKIKENNDSEIQNHLITTRLANELRTLQNQLEQLLKLQEVNAPSDQSSKTSQEAPADSEHDDSLSHESVSSAGDTNKETKEYPSFTKEKQKKQKSGKKAPSVDTETESFNPNINSVRPPVQDNECNPATGEVEHVYNLETLTEQFTTMSDTYQGMKSTICQTLTVQNKEGTRFTIHPGSSYEVEGLDEDGKVVAKVNSQLLLQPDCPEKEREKMSFNTLGVYSATLLSILTVFGGVLVFSPTEFLGFASKLYGLRPSFVRSHISESLAVKMTVDYAVLRLAKSRFADYMSLISEKAPCKQQIIETIHGLVRALSGLAQYTRKLILASAKTMHTDDTYIRCLEWQKDDDGNMIRQHCHLWGLLTGAHEERQGVVYLPTISRDIKSFLRQFGVTEADDGEYRSIFSCSIENLVSDCCSVYDSGIEIVEKLCNRKIKRAACYAHLRRYFREALVPMDLTETFDAACAREGEPRTFPKRLDAELAARGREIGDLGRKVMLALYMIEVIFYFEEDFAVSSREEMEKIRQNYSSWYVNKMFSLVEELREASKSIEVNGERNGLPQYKGGKDVPWGSAVIYALNNKAELCAFLTCGDIECSNNPAERILRPVKSHVRSMEFLQTKTGFMAYADLMTLVETCRLNDVNPYQYIHWVFANAKMRVEDYRLATSKATHSTKQICFMPTPYKKDDKVVGLYDPEFETVFDEVHWTGLDVWSYKKCLEEESSRIKPEYRKSPPESSDK